MGEKTTCPSCSQKTFALDSTWTISVAINEAQRPGTNETYTYPDCIRRSDTALDTVNPNDQQEPWPDRDQVLNGTKVDKAALHVVSSYQGHGLEPQYARPWYVRTSIKTGIYILRKHYLWTASGLAQGPAS